MHGNEVPWRWSKPEQEAFENIKAALCLDSIPCHPETTVELALQYDGVSLSVGATFYYIHTEKYSPKSYVVNFRTQISSSQSEERTMVFTREKNHTSNQNRERCFFHV